ncbi:MAG: hypothetical protein WBR35_16715, partial [Anaerolineae bacterium]
MLSERELLSRIQSDVARLVQAVADAAFWRDRWVEAAERGSQQPMAVAAATFQQVTADVQATFERRSQQAAQEQQRQTAASAAAHQQAMAQALAQYTPALDKAGAAAHA